MRFQNFGGWRFCPYCGKDVHEEVAVMKRKIVENDEAWVRLHGFAL